MKACPKCGQEFLGGEEFCPKDGATLVDMEKDDDDPVVGTTIDNRYHIDSKLGEGGMGVVYLATHAVIGKKCAVKVLRGELSTESEVAERFTQEARAAAAIGNEHIIEINDFGKMPDGSAYFVMEYLDGMALHDLLEDSAKIESDEALDLIAQCCDALAAAHSANIVHRDLKPDNIFLIKRAGRDNFIKILDFGIAKVARESGRLTRTGMIFGTPQYMSPEQAAGSDIDARTDIYSLGIIMYEMLCGHVPFEADTFMGVLTKHLYEEPIPPRRLVPIVDINQSLEAVLLKAIAKKPDRRYQSMTEFQKDINALIEGKTPSIVYDQMRTTSASTAPPMPPGEVISGKKSVPVDDADDDFAQFERKKKWPVFAGIAAAIVVAIGLVVVFTGGGDSDSDAKAETVMLSAPDNPSTAAQPVKENKTPQIKSPEKQNDLKLVDEKSQILKITVDSTPSGARLMDGKKLLGTLPFEIEKAKDKSTKKYNIELDGYLEKELEIADSSPLKITVALEKKEEKEVEDKISKKSKKRSEKKPKVVISEKEPAKEVETIKIKKKKKKKRTAGSDLANPWAK